MNTLVFGKSDKMNRGGRRMCRMSAMRLILCISLVFVLLTVNTAVFAAPAQGAVTLDGYLLTSCCYFGQTGSPALHSLGCLKMPSCAHTGYGIAVLNSFGEYDFYFFDGTFYPASASDPAASGGQALARSIVETSVKSNHIAISVSGILTDEVRTQTHHDGTSGADYKVISVQGITEAASISAVPADLTGYIIDEDCFTGNPDPGSDSIMCLSMPGCAASGYGIAVQGSDGTYHFSYLDGAFSTKTGGLPTGGQLLAANLLQTAAAEDHVTIHITGKYTGEKTKNTAGTNNGIQYPVFTVSELSEVSSAAAPASTATVSNTSASPSADASLTAAAGVSSAAPGKAKTVVDAEALSKTGEKEAQIMRIAGAVLLMTSAGIIIFVMNRKRQPEK